MKRILVIAGLILDWFLGACDRPDVEAFASKYVKSVHADTEHYKRYTPEANLEVAEASRRNMVESFEFAGWDYIAPGNYEYGIKFANGATGVVAVYEEDGEVAAATLIVTLRPSE